MPDKRMHLAGGHLTTGSVEALLEQIEVLSPAPAGAAERFELDVPEHLTLRGKPVGLAIAMAIILDALWAKGFDTDGYETRSDGRRYRYRRGPAA